MPIVNIDASPIDLYLELIDVSKEFFMTEDGVQRRPPGWLPTDANYDAWQEYGSFARRILGKRFGTTNRSQLVRLVFMADRENPNKDSAIRQVSKMFQRINQQVKSSQSVEVPKTVAWLHRTCKFAS